MARPETKKNLSGDVPKILHDELSDWISSHKDVKIRQCLQAMTELWLMLPERLQALLLITKQDSLGFSWITKEVEANVQTLEDSLNNKSIQAPNCVRRLLILLKDYAETRDGIQTAKDLEIALESIHDLLQWIDIKSLDGVTKTDKKAVKDIVTILDSWNLK